MLLMSALLLLSAVSTEQSAAVPTTDRRAQLEANARNAQVDAVNAVIASGSKRRILRELQEMADAGNGYAAWQLGVFLDTGQHDIPIDPDRAFRLFQQAAAQGESFALVSLGLMHAMGRGTPVDYAASMRSYRAGADAGKAHGYYGIAVLYGLGQGVAQNSETALAYFMVAAALQDPEAFRPIQQLIPRTSPTALPAIVARANSMLAEAGRSERVTLDGDRVLFRLRTPVETRSDPPPTS